MSRSTLERTVSQTFQYVKTCGTAYSADFIWHGGEPLVAGLDFYRYAVLEQNRQAGSVVFRNAIQTNGTLLSSEWASFLKAHSFSVSLSIDGPEHLNDRTRLDLGKRSTFGKVMKSFRLLREEGVAFGVCVVISKANLLHADEIFDFLSSERLPFQVIPLTKSGSANGHYDELGLDADEYADPWIRMYDRWFEANQDYVYCSDFVVKTRAILSGHPQDCVAQENCSDHHFSTDPDGNVYPCATLSGKVDWCYGNINDHSLESLLVSSKADRARSRQVDPHCAGCKWQHVCHGGCMQRAYKFFGTHNTRDYYCDSLYRIYEHIESRLRQVESINKETLPPLGYKDLRSRPSERFPQTTTLVAIRV